MFNSSFCINRAVWRYCALVLFALMSGCSKESKQLELGKELFDANCKVCHVQGINGAPILGNKKMWGPRLAQGAETLTQHAIEGYGLMPAKGGKVGLRDDEVATIVRYMISQVQ